MKIFRFILLSLVLFSFSPIPSLAQELVQDDVRIVKARVLEASEGEASSLPGISSDILIQDLKALILEGEDEGSTVEFTNDYILLEEGDTFYLRHTTYLDGREFFTVFEPDRTPVLLFLFLLFFVLVVVFGGIQGLRGLISLAGSLLVIIFVLLPGVLSGYSPLLVAIGVSSIIIILGSYITHGFNKTTSSAVIGMILTVMLTGFLAYFSVFWSKLSGVTDDAVIYLNFNTSGSIDLTGLLLGGIMIGLLGVLYDIAIGQAVSVEELHRVAPHLGRWTIYKRVIRIGREHIGALVNTLAIAYVGVSLPLLLLFYSSGSPDIVLMMNREVFATEIIRILIGSIGLVLAVPITSVLAVYILIKKEEEEVPPETIENEKEKLDEISHLHSH